MLVAMVIGVNPFTLGRTRDWLQNGWAGADSDQVRIVNHVAELLRPQGQDHVAIGYLFHGGPTLYGAKSQSGPVTFDYLLRYGHGIYNTDQCAEGIAPNDEYRIAEAGALADWKRMAYANSFGFDHFRFLRQFGDYVLYRRD